VRLIRGQSERERPAPPRVLTDAGVRYELVGRVGSGAMGDVHAARAVLVGGGLERMVCIKRLGGSVDAEDVTALLEEARLLARVRHANVVSLLGFGEEPGGGPFLVLELVDGLDLKALSRALAGRACGDPLPDRVSVHVACAVLRGLAAVQQSLPGLVHRDVTPHNVLVSLNGEVKLADFGIALARDRRRGTPPPFVKGKLGYMSPEQILGADLDVRSDVFAVGVVLYELLARERPWGPSQGVREMRATLDRPFVPILRRRPSLDRALAAVVERLIAPDRGRRFASAEDALRALAPFGAGELGSLRLASIVSEARARR
jgi:serine/threonine-protein kinase